MKEFVLLSLLVLFSSCSKKQTDKEIPNSYYDRAFECLGRDEYKEAFINFNLAKDVFIRHKDSFDAAKCLTNMAILQEKIGDNFGSQETGLSAISFFDEKNAAHQQYIIANYNNLGLSNYNLKNYKKALLFFDKALALVQDSLSRQITLNNKANTYRELKEYDKALKLYNTILKETRKNNVEYARTLTNLAVTKWLQNPNYNPVPRLQQALHIRLREKDNWGLNSSYAHLVNYYAKTRPDSALIYAKKMYRVSKDIQSPDDQIEALQKLIALENLQNSRHYFKVYQQLNDSLQTARNEAKNQFALIRYETEKNKADFLKTKAESIQRQNHIVKQYLLIGAILLVLVALVLWFKRRQKQLQQEKLLEVKNTELIYSKKVHDRVANKIYQLMSQVENKKDIDRDALLFGLENAYETSRDISYDNKDINENQNYAEQIYTMLVSYASDSVKMIFNGNNDKLWEGLNFRARTEVYLILRELMTNMKKHSQAGIVSIKFARDNGIINISYTDNGIGIGTLSPKSGLRNVKNRIDTIRGTIIFDTGTNNLLKINMSFPV